VVIHRWRQRLCVRVQRRWQVDERKLGSALDDAQHRCVRICEQESLGTIRGTEGTGEFERYTPAFYIEKAREVMGGIDLDPASCEQAQKTVQATEYFTVEDDGLAREWHGRVWLNPPYHRDLAPRFVAKLLDELGRIDEAIMLTNNATDTEWFQAALEHSDVVCFTNGRIRFEVPDGDPVSPTQGQAFFYFGRNWERFAEVFGTIGACVEPV
jgi:ParB family chromosome partitioning protein